MRDCISFNIFLAWHPGYVELQMVDFLLEALKSFVFDLRQQVVFKDWNKWLVISHELELDTSDE